MAEEARLPLALGDQRGDVMKAPDEVSAMLRLKSLGWGSKRIAAELGCARNTVRQWLARGDWRPCVSPSRSRKLDGLSEWLRERFRRHAGNADVVRQELAREKNITVSLRTVERAVAPLRRELIAAARATVRFETQPGEQLQIDFGERRVEIGGVAVKVFLFVATLGYSRRLHVRAYGHEKQDSWFDGMESAFRAFGGVPREVLLDNAKALILHHDPASREVVLHPRLHAFANHWRFRIRACAPYRARTTDEVEQPYCCFVGPLFVILIVCGEWPGCCSSPIPSQPCLGVTGSSLAQRPPRRLGLEAGAAKQAPSMIGWVTRASAR